MNITSAEASNSYVWLGNALLKEFANASDRGDVATGLLTDDSDGESTAGSRAASSAPKSCSAPSDCPIAQYYYSCDNCGYLSSHKAKCDALGGDCCSATFLHNSCAGAARPTRRAAGQPPSATRRCRARVARSGARWSTVLYAAESTRRLCGAPAAAMTTSTSGAQRRGEQDRTSSLAPSCLSRSGASSSTAGRA